MITSNEAFRSTAERCGRVMGIIWRAYADVGQLTTRRCSPRQQDSEWCEAEVHRTAGEIALKSPHPDLAKAEAYFERALAVAREQRAKSWELRAATSMARLWRDQGKRQQARDLLAPIYGWFTECFETPDLRDAKSLLGALDS
jgi:predicted ATPase